LITVSPLGIERLIRRLGIRAERAGAPKMIGGQAMFACWIAVQPMPTL
jgi:N-acyl-L-homoserine lactone synthetase